MLLLIALTCFLAVALGLTAVASRPPNRVQARAEALGSDTRVGDTPTAAVTAGDRSSPLMRQASRAVRQLLPRRWYQRIEQMLIAAGEPVDASRFMVLWAVLAIVFPVLGARIAGLRGLILLGLIGIALPYWWLRRAVLQRRQRISKALPDAMDLLVTCVEAGLGLDAALIRVGEATEGPLGDEIQITLREIAVGRPRAEALIDFGARSGVPDLDGFVRPIVQAERAGVSIGNALRAEAESLREQRRQRARAAAEKLPAKMSIVLGLFFLPALLLVVGGAAVFALIHALSGLAGV